MPCLNYSETIFLQFDMYMDEESFNLLFKELPIKEEEGERKITSFIFANDKPMTKNGFIPSTILKIQEIIKHKSYDSELKLEHVFMKYHKSVLKINIEESLNKVDFWTINYQGEYKWNVSYFSLRKVESISSFNHC